MEVDDEINRLTFIYLNSQQEFHLTWNGNNFPLYYSRVSGGGKGNEQNEWVSGIILKGFQHLSTVVVLYFLKIFSPFRFMPAGTRGILGKDKPINSAIYLQEWECQCQQLHFVSLWHPSNRNKLEYTNPRSEVCRTRGIQIISNLFVLSDIWTILTGLKRIVRNITST